MNKLIELFKCSNQWSISGNGSIVNRVLAARRTLTTSSSSSALPTPSNTTSLYSRLAVIINLNHSIVPILDQWVQEGGKIDPEDIRTIVKQFRNSKRLKHCLQIVQWMNDKKYVDPSPREVSVQLDLISKVHGVEEAEAYFDSIPNSLRVYQVYGALLKCYAKAKLLEKAEATMQKMKKLGYVSSFSYNSLLTLYSQLGNHEKLDHLVHEMEEKGINCDKYTYSIRLNAYNASSDIKRIDTLLMKMEADPLITMEWNSYASAANAYLKVGATEKAFATLKKAERVIRGEKRLAYEFLITLYANVGKRDEVYRIWNLNKKLGRFYNRSYLMMITSLSKLDDLDGAEKILEEWEAGMTYYDYRLPNFLLTAYCKKGLIRKAELIVEKLIETGKEPNASTWSRMALGYVEANQMDNAVEATKKSILVSEPPRTPDVITLVSCLEYLNGKGDHGEAEEIMKSLQVRGLLTRNLYENMVKKINKENQISKASTEMGGDGHSTVVETTGTVGSECGSIS